MDSRRPASLLAAAALACAALGAQGQDIRYLGGSRPAGRSNAFPWGSAGLRYQVIAPASLLGSKAALVQDLLVLGGHRAGRPPADDAVVYDDIEIRMGMTSAAAVTRSWAANNPRPSTVYRGPLRVSFEVGKWRGIGLPRAFGFAPQGRDAHLCIEVIVYAVRGQPPGRDFFYTPTAPALPRAFRPLWVNNRLPPQVGAGAGALGILLDDGNVVTLGHGCRGSNGRVNAVGAPPGTWPQLGKTFRVTLDGAAPNSAAFLMIGSSDVVWGAQRLPIDLAAAGAPGCKVWNDVVLSLASGTDARGLGGQSLKIPNARSVWGARLLCSWGVIDRRANAFGWTTSGYAKLIVGS